MRRTRGCVSVFWITFIHKILRKKSSNHSGRSRDGSPRTLSILLVLSLLVDAGCCVGITVFCENDVGYVGVAELEEPVDKPGTTIAT